MKCILVAVDDSPRAPAVLQAGIEYARRTGAKIRLLRVVGMPADLPISAWTPPPTQVVDSMLTVAKRDLAELAGRVPSALLETVTVEIGVAWDAICATAREHDAELIVIGSPGHGFFERLVGTTAAKVVNHADRAVLVVPANAPREVGARASPTSTRA